MPRPAVKPRAAGKRRRLVYAVALLGILTALAPTIIAAVGLHNRILSGILPSEAGTLTARTASIGWFSRTELAGVRICTPDGQVLVEIATVTVDRTLIDLLGDSTNLGIVRAERPVLRLVAKEASSNIEAFLDRLLEAQDNPPSAISGTLNVADGRIEFIDRTAGQTATFAIEDLACQIADGDLTSLRTALISKSAAGMPGKLTVHYAAGDDAPHQLEVAARNWPVETGSVALRRILTGAHTSGLLSLDATASWSQDGGLESSGVATLTRLELDAASLGSDRLELSELRVPWKVRREGNGLLVDDLSLTSDVGQVTLRGELPVGFTTRSVTKLSSSDILRTPFAASGSIDLARLAAMLPQTLRIKSRVVVSSGRAEFNLESRPGGPAQHWIGSLAISDLTARDQDRQLQWERPLVIAASVRRDDEWAVESVTCRSDFLQLAASGNARQMDGEVTFDLSRLAADLGRFVNIAEWNLGGRGALRAQWRPVDADVVRTSISGSVNALRFVDTRGHLWQEPAVQLNADFRMSLPQGGDELRLENGSTLTLSTVKDRASVKLDGPLVVPLTGGPSQLGASELQVEGELAGWLGRLSPWVNLAPWRLDGGAKLVAHLELGSSSISAKSLQLVLTNLQAVGPGWRIQEPQVTLETSGRYSSAKGELQLGETTLVGSAASLRARNTQVVLEEGLPPRVRCEAAVLLSLQRVDAWRIGDDGRPLPLRPAGTAKGTARIEERPNGLHSELSATVSDFAVHEYVAAIGGRQPGYRPAWQEAQLELAAKATYTKANDHWEIQQAVIRSNSLAAAVVGSMADVSGRCETNVRGTIEYDLADVGPLLAAYLGLDMTLTGREQATFELIGPLRESDSASARVVSLQGGGQDSHWSQRLRGHAAAGWETIQLFGLPIGRGQVDAQFYGGEATFAPLDVRVGQAGRLTTSARARLAPPPAELDIASGPVVANVEITPDVSDRMLKYFIPSLAGAVETQGRFSLDTVGGRVPLLDPRSVEASGTLTVHSAQVRPGRVGREWILVAEQIEALLKSRAVPQLSTRPQRDLMTFDEQTVPYRITAGRVYHENLVFRVGEVLVRSQGSVGFDHSLAILVEVPVQDAWIEGKPQLARFKGQTIRGTIRGTFDKLDYGTLISDLAQQVGQGLLEGAVENELNKALDRLLRPQ